ncbi:unnamed protein product, partial [Protopolystoma xenopodis]
LIQTGIHQHLEGYIAGSYTKAVLRTAKDATSSVVASREAQNPSEDEPTMVELQSLLFWPNASELLPLPQASAVTWFDVLRPKSVVVPIILFLLLILLSLSSSSAPLQPSGIRPFSWSARAASTTPSRLSSVDTTRHDTTPLPNDRLFHRLCHSGRNLVTPAPTVSPTNYLNSLHSGLSANQVNRFRRGNLLFFPAF